jgi:hypothetical protein
MTLRGKCLSGMVAVIATMTMIAGSTAASKLSISGTQWRIAWNRVEISGAFGSGVTCPGITLEGSLHSRTIAKVRESLIGYVTNAAGSGICTGGVISRASVLTAGLPWHVRYTSFSGALPTISSIALRIIGFEYQITEAAFGINCLVRSNESEAEDIVMTWSRASEGRIGGATLNNNVTFNCAGLALQLNWGTAAVSPANTVTLI